MELKDRKYIKNTRSLPKYEDGATTYMNIGEIQPLNSQQLGLTADNYINNTPQFNNQLNNKQPTVGQNQYLSDSAAAGAGPWFAIGSWLGGGVMDGLNQIKNSDEFYDQTGYRTGNIGGIGYQKKDNLDIDKYMKDYKQETAKSFLTNPGRGLTMLFGKNKQKRELDIAQNNINKYNEMVDSSTMTAYLQQELARKFGNNNSQTLYAKCGKNPKYANGKQVYSAFGPVNAKPDSKVSKGEVAIDTRTGSMYRIPTGPNDTALFAGGKDPNIGIVTNKYGLSDYAMVNPFGALQIQAELKNEGKLSKSKYEYKCGKLPKYDLGKPAWDNIISSAVTAQAGLLQYLQAKKDKAYKPNTFIANPYINRGLNILAGLDTNEYPIIQNLRNAQAISDNAITMSGGLHTAQKNLSRIASLNATQNNIAQTLASAQLQKNAYKTQYANSAMQYGDKLASDRMNAMRHDLDYFSKSNAARQQQMRMGVYDLINALQQYYANNFNINRYNDTMDLYRSLHKLDMDKYNYAINNPGQKIYFG